MKKYGALILALTLVLTLSACGKNESPDTNDQGTQSNNDSNISAPSNSTGSPTDDFLKTITAETAEAKGVCGPDLTWYYQDNVLVIKGTGEMTDYDSNWYTEAPWGEDSEDKLYEKIGWVIIDEGVTSIGQNAFMGCAISKIDLPSTLEKIGVDSFRGCGALRKIIFNGDVPEDLWFMIREIFDNEITIYYSSDTFDEQVSEYPGINWVKQ